MPNERRSSKVFDTVRELWEISGKLGMLTPLRIGAQSAAYSVASVPVLLSYNAEKNIYQPFIPGSSLKGVLRHGCQRIVNTQGYNKGLVESIFGGGDHAAKIIVRDAVSEEGWTEERLHFGTTTERGDDGYYHVKMRGGKPLGHLIDEEYVVPVDFPVRIELINPSKEEIALLFDTLDEFNHLRLHIGGGISRGYGFARLDGLSVIKMSVKELEITKEQVDMKEFWGIPTKEQLPPTGERERDTGFSFYAHADNTKLCGCVTVEFEVECLTDFQLKGADERIQTCGGCAVIPGSTIKGFLRHACYGDKPKLNWDASKVDDIFGSTKYHASRVLVSDAISDYAPDEDCIPKGDKLKCWIVFDNMEEDDIKELLNLLCSKDGVVITGKTAAKQKGNKVKFVPTKAWKYTRNSPKYDVLKQVKDVIKNE